MDEISYRALVARKEADGRVVRQVEQRETRELSESQVLVRWLYSSLNYKDALSASGRPGVTKDYPHVPGIDGVGEVVAAGESQWKPGQQVVIDSPTFGVSAEGGFQQYAEVPASWLLPLPANLEPLESMALGTAGLTAAQSLEALQQGGLTPGEGEILVTGATGGVGSLALTLLARLGYRVTAVTGKADQHDWLRALGASEVIGREQALDTSGRPLLPGRWAGAVDTVGGEYLATAIKSTRPGGTVAACGNVAGAELRTTVFPFILRGVRLIGIDTTQLSGERRRIMWEKLGGEWRIPNLLELVRVVSLNQLDREIETILSGGQSRRVVVDLSL